MATKIFQIAVPDYDPDKPFVSASGGEELTLSVTVETVPQSINTIYQVAVPDYDPDKAFVSSTGGEKLTLSVGMETFVQRVSKIFQLTVPDYDPDRAFVSESGGEELTLYERIDRLGGPRLAQGMTLAQGMSFFEEAPDLEDTTLTGIPYGGINIAGYCGMSISRYGDL